MPMQDVAIAAGSPRSVGPPPAVPSSCRPGTLAEALSRPDADQAAALLKAVADPVRLQLISLIAGAPGQEACVCELTPAVGLSQPTVSHHLKVLADAGVVERDKRGTWAWFRLVPARLSQIASAVTDPGRGRFER